MTNTAQTTILNHISKQKTIFPKIARLLDLVKISKERFILPDYDAVVMNLDDYEDMLFMSNPKIQKEIKKAEIDYKKTGGISLEDYKKSRAK